MSVVAFAGQRNGHAKLTDSDVRRIRRLYTTGKYTYAQLARQYGITPSAIGLIIRKQRWSHLP